MNERQRGNENESERGDLADESEGGEGGVNDNENESRGACKGNMSES